MKSIFSQRPIVRLIQLSLISWLLVILAAVPRASLSAPSAKTLYVAPGGSDSYNCLTPNTACEHVQWAIDQSASGDTINIAAGTYNERLGIFDKSLTLKGQGATTTIIDGQQQGKVLSVFSNTPQTIDVSGLTLQNGTSSDPGGGIYIEGATLKVNLVDSSVLNNTGSFGGGIFNNGFLSLNSVIISGNRADSLEGGGIVNNGYMDLNGVTLINNRAPQGGGISNINTMTVTASVVSNNSAIGSYGGGIFNRGSSSKLTLLNSTVSGNKAIGTDGGGVYNDNIFISSGSIISGNLAVNRGGGIFNNASGKVTFSSGTLRYNTAQAVEGGGLYNAGAATFGDTLIHNNLAGTGGGVYNATGAQLTIGTSNIGPNSATNQTGGGIENLGTLTMLQSALVYNTAAAAPGGGLHNFGNAGTAALTDVTISDNTATGGGGIQNDGGAVQVSFSTISNNTGTPALNNASGSVTVANSILAQSSGPACGGTITSGTHNIDSGTSCGFVPANLDYSSTDPKLGPLQDNGGNSLTRAIAFSSLARDTAAANCPPFDQRGISRPQSTKCDRGAYEVIGYSGTGTGIPPNQCVNSTFTINDNLVIGRAQVGVYLTYNNRADLTVNVIAPNNRKVILLGPTGNSGQDLDTLFDDNATNQTVVPSGSQTPTDPHYQNSYKPYTPLAQLRGTNLKGAWKLEICNSSLITSGTLNSWVIVVPEVSKLKVYLPLIRRSR